MSTKTTFKRVALVAVAALGLGVVTVAPSQATINADSLTLSSATVAQTTAETSTASSAVATISYLSGGTATLDSMTVTASLVSGPSTSVALPYLHLVETSSAAVDSISVLPAASIAPNTRTVVKPLVSGNQVVTAKFRVYLGTSATAAPTVAGTYVVRLTPALGTGADGGGNATAQTLTITVTQAASLDNVGTSATVIINKGETISATSDAVVTHPNTVSTGTAAATITVVQKNAAGVELTAAGRGESFTAVITGPGTLGASSAWTDAGNHNAVATGRALSVQVGDFVAVFPDGSSGEATITITSKAGVVLGTKKVTFHGDAASISAKATGAATGSVGIVGTALNLITFNVKDAAGTEVTTGTYYVVTSSTSIANSAAYTACNAWNATDGFTCPVTGVTKGTANLFVTNRASATATTPTTEVKSGNVAIRIGSATVGSIKITTDKTSYTPGEKGTLTLQVIDTDGNVVPSGRYNSVLASGGITSSYALGANSDTTTAVDAINTVDGAATFTFYVPQIVSGDIVFSWTTGTNFATTAAQGVKGSTTISVTNPVADAATDAANEATDAANAATDAALAAADAADAATAAAQDASDAVAALSASVSKMISSLRAQITSLTNLVIKIQKKVRA